MPVAKRVSNNLVLKGFSAIPDLLTHDSFYGSIGNTKNLTGGRYRPLSLVSFAVEVSVFGKNPFVHHLINVLLFAITAIILLKFLRRFIFVNEPVAAFVTTLLFVVHPIHTEVVANIKSRDEIFSLLFLLLTLHFLLRYLKENKQQALLIQSLLFYLLAMFSKENGLIFAVLIPCTIYFFTSEKPKSIASTSIPFLAVAIFYLFIRFTLLGFRNNEVAEVMDNPYLMATTVQKTATILFVFLQYLRLLIFPYPLSYDYSFNQIPYQQLTNPQVATSMLLVAALLIVLFRSLKSKNLIGWNILFFFGTFVLVSNLFFNVGAPMAERFMYQASVPFLIAVVLAGRSIHARLKNVSVTSPVFLLLLSAIFISASYATIARNAEWKTDDSLFLHDVKTVPNSARANTYAGVALVRISDSVKDSAEKTKNILAALGYFRVARSIEADYLPTLLNMGVAYSRIDSPEAAEAVWNIARTKEPLNPTFKTYDEYLSQTYYRRGLKSGAEKNYASAIRDLEKSVQYDATNANGWYNLGGAYYSVQDYSHAKTAWEKALQLNPDLPQAQQGLNAISHLPLQ